MIPKISAQDRRIWFDSDTRDLSFKITYLTIKPSKQSSSWCKSVWNKFLKGCSIVSVCSLCMKDCETSELLFLNCPFAINIWNLFNNLFDCNLDLNSFQSILSFYEKDWTSQLHDIISAVIVNVLCVIWFCRNLARFEGKAASKYWAINMVCANVSLSGNSTSGTMHSFIKENSILKKFSIRIHHVVAPLIKLVSWFPPSCY